MQHSPLPRLLAAGLAVWFAPFLATPAAAHAIVVSSDPAADAVLHGSTVPVELRFNSRIDHERSRLTLMRPDSSATVLPLKPDSSADTMVTRIDGLAPGHYRLRWQVLATDGHITRGDIPFEIAP